MHCGKEFQPLEKFLIYRMDWEGNQDADMIMDNPSTPLTAEKEMCLIHLIFSYFQDSEVRGTMTNLGFKELENQCISQDLIIKGFILVIFSNLKGSPL